MPLHGKAKGMSGKFHCLYQTVGGVGGRPQAGREPFDRLVMQAVHFDAIREEDLFEPAAWVDFNRVGQVITRPIWVEIVFESVRFSRCDIGIERTTQPDVHQLDTTADPEKWGA
jgi:hypothetical protein